MKKVKDYTEEEIYSVMGEVGGSISKAAKRLGVEKAELARRLAEFTLSIPQDTYLFDEDTLEALTCPYCKTPGPPVTIDDPSEYLFLAYGGKMDSKAIAGLHIYGTCGVCHKEIRLVYGIVEMRTGEASAEVARRLARRVMEWDKKRRKP